jgi:hypothetical protein
VQGGGVEVVFKVVGRLFLGSRRHMGKEVQTNVGVKLLKFGQRFIHRQVVEVVERDLMKL